MSTDKPKHYRIYTPNATYSNYLYQNSHQNTLNLVWVSYFTYIKAGDKWYYLCIIMNLFSRKSIAWHILVKADTNFVIIIFQKAYKKQEAKCPYLKKEETNQRTYHTLQELQNSIFEYIERFYNSKRPHHLLGFLTPNEIENLYWEQH